MIRPLALQLGGCQAQKLRPQQNCQCPGGFPVAPAQLGGWAAANPVPYINEISPVAALPGASGFTLTVNGTGYVSGAGGEMGGGDHYHGADHHVR